MTKKSIRKMGFLDVSAACIWKYPFNQSSFRPVCQDSTVAKFFTLIEASQCQQIDILEQTNNEIRMII